MMQAVNLIRRYLGSNIESRRIVSSLQFDDVFFRQGKFQQFRLLSSKRKKQKNNVKKRKGAKNRQDQKSNSSFQPMNPPQKIQAKNPENPPNLGEERKIPPAFLAPTGSPFVYVSRPALLDDYHGDEDYEEDANIVGSDDDEMLIPSETGRSESEQQVEDNNLEDEEYWEEEEANRDPARSLFLDPARGNIPSLLSSSTFHYISPKDLKWSLPKHKLPEVAFLGRSNVGKSSLINALMRQKLCLTSKSPGRTQQAYYYGLIPNSVSARIGKDESKLNIASAAGFVIDLPGYGYAKAPDGVVGDWQSTTQDILLDRRDAGVLQRLYLLIDSRRDGPQSADRSVMSWLDQAEIPYTVVLTKADRVAIPLVIKQVNDFCLRYASQHALEDTVEQSPVIHVTSSTQSMGIRELMYSVETDFLGYER